MSDVQHITVSEDDDGQRLDRWLKKHLPHVPYGLVQKLIRKGQLRVDGKRTKADKKLAAGQSVRIPPVSPPKYIGNSADIKPAGGSSLLSQDSNYVKSLVIYDDGDVLALNKPAGLAVQGGTKIKRHIDGMLDALANKEGVRPRLVHRLDKDTSGVLLLARSGKMAKALGALFKGRKIKKIYWGIVSPTPDPPRGAVNAPLIKAGGANKERMVVDDKQGKNALSEYVVLDHALDKAAFVAFWPRTGRTHQIRVHAELMGCPILGDRKYKGGKEPLARQHGSGADVVTGRAGLAHIEYARRLHLHAQRVILPHPARKGLLDVSAPLPKDLVKSWKAFGFDPHYAGDPFADIEP